MELLFCIVGMLTLAGVMSYLVGMAWMWFGIAGVASVILYLDYRSEERTKEKSSSSKEKKDTLYNPKSKEVSKYYEIYKKSQECEKNISNQKSSISKMEPIGIDYGRMKREYLEKMTEYIGKIVECFDIGWAAKRLNYNQIDQRVAFLGPVDLYIFLKSTPPETWGFGPGSKWIPWPSETWIGNKDTGYKSFKHTFYHYVYPDCFGFAPIREYEDSITGTTISTKGVVKWVAEKLITELKRIYPEIKIGHLEETENGGQFYYYFTYTVPEPGLKTFY